MFSWPLGTCRSPEKLGCVIEVILEESQYRSFRLTSIPPEGVKMLEAIYPGKFTFTALSDLFDYVYSAQKLSDLSGKKLHAKRNHINRFISEYNWSYESVTSDNIDDCAEILKMWNSEGNEQAEGEETAIKTAFRDFEPLELIGGLLYTEGKPVAFAIGEKLSSDTFVVHFEKAIAETTGAYSMINREFVRHIMRVYPDTKYINREEDMGIAGLRKAKLSYNPVKMVKKYTGFYSMEGEKL